jgi:hypothetical protein
LKQGRGEAAEHRAAANMVRIEIVTLFPEMVHDSAARPAATGK